MSDSALAVAWLTRENFAAHKMLDPAGLPSTYDAWLRNAEAAVERLVGIDVLPQRVVIDAHELARWCTAQGCTVNGAARAGFVAYVHDRMRKSASKEKLLSTPSTISIAGLDTE